MSVPSDTSALYLRWCRSASVGVVLGDDQVAKCTVQVRHAAAARTTGGLG